MSELCAGGNVGSVYVCVCVPLLSNGCVKDTILGLFDESNNQRGKKPLAHIRSLSPGKNIEMNYHELMKI